MIKTFCAFKNTIKKAKDNPHNEKLFANYISGKRRM